MSSAPPAAPSQTLIPPAPLPRTTIQPLDPLLINQIAAGEVIERPASVVKELMENALDAGATRIDVAMEEGGIALVSVADDGCGIPAEELPLALAAHATSKVRTLDDLAAIGTLGFRGEALASIAAVSRLTLISRPPDRPDAGRITAESGGVSAVSPFAAPPGTTVEVRQLFHNIPARRKFLRTVAAEMAQCGEQIARLALAHPQVAITQLHQGRVVRRLPATPDRRARIGDFFGADLAADLIPFRSREPDLIIEGWFAPPAASRASSKWQYVFLNGRFIRDREISGFVLREAFRGLIEPARFPVVFIFLTADPHSFDANVHPTKIEVRWRDAGRVKSQVLAVLRETLLSRDLTPALRPHAAEYGGAEYGAAGFAEPTAEPRDDTPEQFAARIAALRPPAPPARGLPFGPSPAARPFDPTALSRGIDALYRPVPAHPAPPPTPADAAQPPSAVAAGQGAAAADESSAGADPASADDRFQVAAIPGDLPPGRAIQIHNAYLVCETADGLVIVDQHALHERILFEEFAARLTRGPLESQRLLLPETLEVAPEQLAALDGAGDLLRQLGLEVEPFGQNCVAIQAAPAVLSERAVIDFVKDLLDKLVDSPRIAPETLLNDALAMMACKAAVKAGDPLTAESIDALLARRHTVDRSSNCPHGRPTTLRLTMRDLEKQFKRT